VEGQREAARLRLGRRSNRPAPHWWPPALLAGALAVVLALGAVGCSASGRSLEGTSWRLTGWTLSSLNPSEFAITARFSDGTISGNGGVNSYNGPVRLGPGDAFSAGPLGQTTAAGPESSMRAEAAYTTLLGQARSFKVVGEQLTLYDEGGNESLIFEATDK